MDLSNAQTEPFYRLSRSHSRVNKTVKVLVVATRSLFDTLSAQDPTKKLEAMIRREEQVWNFPHVYKVDDALRMEVIAELADGAFVRVFSLFDDYLTGVEAELSRAGISGVPAESSQAEGDEEESDGDRTRRFTARFALSSEALDGYLPVHRMFQLIRNCVAHRDSRVSKALRAAADSEAVHACLADWPTQSGQPVPDVPVPEVGCRIQLHPKHAILAAASCLRIAGTIDKLVVNQLGESGMLRMAAHHSLLNGSSEILPSTLSSPQAVVNSWLTDKYLITAMDGKATPALLKQIDLWDACVKEFNDRTTQ